MKTKILQLLISRKFWAALVGVLLVVFQLFQPEFPLEADEIVDPMMQMIAVAGIIISYILGTAIEDAGRGNT